MTPPPEPEPGRLEGRVDALDGLGGGRIYVDGGGYRHFTEADWGVADVPPGRGWRVTFRPAGGSARDVTPVVLARRGTIEAVITLGPQRGSGRIQTGAGLVYFEAADWLGASPPSPGQPVRYTHRGRDRATRVEPESVPDPAPPA